MLTAAQIADLAADGCEIGAHSMTHPQLDCLPRPPRRRGDPQSKDVLEQVLGRPVDTFAYPHGYHDRAVKELVIAAGYTSAAAVRNASAPPRTTAFALARVTVMSDFGTADIARVLTGAAYRRPARGSSWRTRLWRQARRLPVRQRPARGWPAMMPGDLPRPAGRVARRPGRRPTGPARARAGVGGRPLRRRAVRRRQPLLRRSDGRSSCCRWSADRACSGLGGWLLCLPASWGIGGLVGAGADADVLRAVLADLRATRQPADRSAARPDPLDCLVGAAAVDGSVLTDPPPGPRDRPDRRRRARGLAEMSKSARRGTRLAETRRRPGRDRPHRRPARGLLPALPALGRPLGRAAARAAGAGPVPGPPAGSAEPSCRRWRSTWARRSWSRWPTSTTSRPSARSPCWARPPTTPGRPWTGSGSARPTPATWCSGGRSQLACELGCTAYHLGESGQSASPGPVQGEVRGPAGRLRRAAAGAAALHPRRPGGSGRLVKKRAGVPRCLTAGRRVGRLLRRCSPSLADAAGRHRAPSRAGRRPAAPTRQQPAAAGCCWTRPSTTAGSTRPLEHLPLVGRRGLHHRLQRRAGVVPARSRSRWPTAPCG